MFHSKQSRYLLDLFSFNITSITISKDLIFTYILKNNVYIDIFFKYLKYHCYFKFNLLADICVVDYLTFLGKSIRYTTGRFELNYNVYSLHYNFRIILSVGIEDQKSTPSIIKIFNNANWLEREAWDLYGIIVSKHTDLRRLFTDYGFKGFPLRKDFPLCGYLEILYDDENKAIAYTPVELAQDYRHFIYKMVWKKQ